MPVHQIVSEFQRHSRDLGDVRAFQSLFEDAARELGFDYVALVHHVDLRSIPVSSVAIANYPDAWIERILARGYYVDDPIHVATQKTSRGFQWSEIDSFIAMTPRQRTILKEASRAGLSTGFSVPVNIPGEYSGSCSFGRPAREEIGTETSMALHYLGAFAFEAAQRLIRFQTDAMPDELGLTLTDRQLDCVVLVSQGKSDWEIATILGISPNTVHFHIEGAKRRMGVHSRMQLVVRALFEGQLSFADALGRQPT